MLLFLISACSINATSSTSDKSVNTLTPEEEKLYHDRFDLNDIQKDELRVRGYSEKEIAMMDNVDFQEAEKTWIISKEQIFYIKGTHTELGNVDITNWTNADVHEYRMSLYEKQREETAPTLEQVAELEKRGISLDIAHKMLRDYIKYDNLLAQSDSILNELKGRIIEADEQMEDYIKKMDEIRARYKDTH